jgi:hypothetical protein
MKQSDFWGRRDKNLIFTKKLKKNLIFILALIVTISLVAGCSKSNTDTLSQDKEAEIEPVNEQESAPVTISEPEFKDPAQCPLCGETVEKQDIDKRAVAVMIENQALARPQSGMLDADIIYELSVEGGITRFLAVYLHRSPEIIGPVRSSRHYFLDLVLEYNAIYAYYGFSPQAQVDIPKLKIQGINGLYDGYTYWRDDTRKQPHDAYTSMEKITTRSEKLGFKNDRASREFKFSSNDYIPSEADAPLVKINYPVKYTVSFEYEPDNKRYLRYINDKPHTDRETGEQLSARNIIIQYVQTKVIDSVGRLDIALVGKGEGYYITGGGMEKIKWEKKIRSGATTYYDFNGKEISLNPGQTWVQIVPLKTKVTFGGDTDENK